ncbi:hypothetical protein IAT38_005718 [Cryptococcus sp. DSM 104549]
MSVPEIALAHDVGLVVPSAPVLPPSTTGLSSVVPPLSTTGSHTPSNDTVKVAEKTTPIDSGAAAVLPADSHSKGGEAHAAAAGAGIAHAEDLGSSDLSSAPSRRNGEQSNNQPTAHVDGAPPAPKDETIPVEEGPEFLQPDHFSPLNNNPNGAAASRNIPNIGDGWLSPEDDPQALRGIPVFKPTLEEFADFEGYATKTTAWGRYSGIVKIIPPADWIACVPPIPKPLLSETRISTPIQQNLIGSSGLFRIANVVRNKHRPLTVEEWFKKCNEKKFCGPGPKDVDRTTNRDSKEAKERVEKVKEEMRREKERRREKRKAAEERRMERAVAEATDTAMEEEQVNGDVSTAPAEGIVPEAATEGVNDVPALDPSHNSPHSHSSPDPIATTPPAGDAVEPWYQSFNPTEDWLPENTRPEDYTVEACAAMERRFWKNMGIAEPSWYGADMEGSLFVDEKTPWNVAHLPNLLNRWDLRNLPGVNTPYLYFGMWGASFAWHVEDMDLFSINYIHFGAPKFWYAIPQQQAERFERVLEGYFPEDARNCDQFLRHKAFAVSPYRLANEGIRVNMLVHNQGEFVITYPRGYHAGFNMGFNCAESVNFALDSWVELGRRAKACQCVNHSVRIDVDEMIAKEAKEAARIKGEQELLAAIEEERRAKKPRKRPAGEDGATPRKKLKTIAPAEDAAEPATAEHPDTQSGEVKPKAPKKRAVKPAADAPAPDGVASPAKIPLPRPPKQKETPVTYPCILCPSQGTDDLLPVYQPTDAVKTIWKPRQGEVKAHHHCALAMPGVGIEDRKLEGEGVEPGSLVTYIVGVENVESARWKLKCAACTDKKLQKMGAKVQCTKGKCPRAFHVSCARDSDTVDLKISVVQTVVPVVPLEGDEPMPEGAETQIVEDIHVELLCPQHNPAMKERLEQQKADAFQRKVMAIPVGSRIKVKMRTGASIEYVLVEARPDTQQIYVQDDEGAGALFAWTSIDFRPTQGKMLENEYARVHTHSRRTDGRSGVNTPTRDVPAGRLAAGGQPSPAPRHVHSGPLRMDEMLNPQPSPRQAPANVGASGSRLVPQPVLAPQGHPARPESQPPQQPDHYVHYHAPPQQALIPSYRSHPIPPPPGVPQQLPPAGYNMASNGGLQLPPPPVSKADVWRTGPPALGGPVGSAGGAGYGAPLQMAGAPYGGAGLPPLVNGHGAAQTGPPANGGGPPVAGVTEAAVNGVGKIDLGLERMQALMRGLRPLTVPAIHLSGTNGKGSVSAILESCFLAAGMSCGRYNSPHLIEPRDAIRINGQPPSKPDYDAAMAAVHHVNNLGNLGATTFELATAAAYHLINSVRPPLDVMIIECGLGGARDATNVIPPEITLASALTSVGLDHTTFLGETVEEITAEKSQIAVGGGLFVVGRQPYTQVYDVARRVAEGKGARVFEALASQVSAEVHPMSLQPFQPPPPIPVTTTLPPIPSLHSQPTSFNALFSLPGVHQLDNLSLALAILHVLRHDDRARSIQPGIAKLTDSALQWGVQNCKWEGRCSWLAFQGKDGRVGPVLVDGAHNADSATTLRFYMDTVPLTGPRPKVRFIISLSSSPGKSIQSVLKPLLRPGDEVEVVEFTTPVEGMPWIKATSREETASVAASIVGPEAVRTGGSGVGGVMAAVGSAVDEGRWAVVCGSLYLVADVYRMLGKTV